MTFMVPVVAEARVLKVLSKRMSAAKSRVVHGEDGPRSLRAEGLAEMPVDQRCPRAEGLSR